MSNQILTNTPPFNRLWLRRAQWGFSTALVLAAICWGFGTVMTKNVLTDVPPLTLLVVQLAASLAFLWTLVAVRRPQLRWNRPTVWFSLAGVLNPGWAYTFGLLGLAYTTATMSALLWAAEPILILALAGLILGERLTIRLVLLSAVALAGVFLVIGAGASLAGGGAWLGNGLVILGIFCCAFYTVLARRAVVQIDALLLIALQQTVALGWALAIWPVEWSGDLLASLAMVSSGRWGWAVASGVVYYALAFWFYITGLRQIPAGQAALFLNLIPIFGVGSAYLFLGERLALIQGLGAGLILAAVMGIGRLYNSDKVETA